MKITIVPDHEIMTRQQMRDEGIWRLATLLPELSQTEEALNWCARRKLVKNNMTCTRCHRPCALNRYRQGVDGVRWACDRCGVRKSVREGSFFSRSHLEIKQILILAYCWACDMPQLQMAREADVQCLKKVVDWCAFMREETENWIAANPDEIGGFDDNGQSIIVEIDETKFFHRKYHRGQWREGHWVFGGIERHSGRCFLVQVADRRAVTLQAAIEQHILPGSHIISDGWAAYAHIDQINQGLYQHSVVVHDSHFVDPHDDTVHTQNIENMWMRAKRKLKRQFGTSRALFPQYLHEFVYRNRFRNEDIFGNFLITLADNYA